MHGGWPTTPKIYSKLREMPSSSNQLSDAIHTNHANMSRPQLGLSEGATSVTEFKINMKISQFSRSHCNKDATRYFLGPSNLNNMKISKQFIEQENLIVDKTRYSLKDTRHESDIQRQLSIRSNIRTGQSLQYGCNTMYTSNGSRSTHHWPSQSLHNSQSWIPLIYLKQNNKFRYSNDCTPAVHSQVFCEPTFPIFPSTDKMFFFNNNMKIFCPENRPAFNPGSTQSSAVWNCDKKSYIFGQHKPFSNTRKKTKPRKNCRDEEKISDDTDTKLPELNNKKRKNQDQYNSHANRRRPQKRFTIDPKTRMLGKTEIYHDSQEDVLFPRNKLGFIPLTTNVPRKVEEINPQTGERINIFTSCSEASRKMGINRTRMSRSK